MSSLAPEQCSQILRTLRDRFDPGVYDTWLAGIAFLADDDGTVTIPLANEFIRQHFEKTFRGSIEETLSHALGAYREVRFLVDASSAAPQVAPAAVATVRPRAAEPAPPAPTPPAPILSDRLSFEHFVVGPSNRLAHAAALSVAERPGDVYNPLFIHGAVGLGKTHLLHAICHSLLQRLPNARVEILSCEEFVNRYISAVQKGRLESFRNHFRTLEILLVDDVHFLADKESSQEEFFHTFNALHNGHRQIVLSSDSRPKDIPTLTERLVSRFTWGMIAPLDAPAFEMRVAILRRKAEVHGTHISDDVLAYVARNLQSNVRELEGAIVKIIGLAALDNHPIDIPLAREALRDCIDTKSPEVTLPQIINSVCRQFQVRPSDLRSRRRAQSISVPRQVCIYLARTLTRLSLEEIGTHFGGKDHSTILYACDRIKNLRETDLRLAATLDRLATELRNPPAE